MVTIGDRVRYMSDAELAIFISRVALPAYKAGVKMADCSFERLVSLKDSLVRCWYRKLQQPVESVDWRWLNTEIEVIKNRADGS